MQYMRQNYKSINAGLVNLWSAPFVNVYMIMQYGRLIKYVITEPMETVHFSLPINERPNMNVFLIF
jgi:hypothetical protein